MRRGTYRFRKEHDVGADERVLSVSDNGQPFEGAAGNEAAVGWGVLVVPIRERCLVQGLLRHDAQKTSRFDAGPEALKIVGGLRKCSTTSLFLTKPYWQFSAVILDWCREGTGTRV